MRGRGSERESYSFTAFLSLFVGTISVLFILVLGSGLYWLLDLAWEGTAPDWVVIPCLFGGAWLGWLIMFWWSVWSFRREEADV